MAKHRYHISYKQSVDKDLRKLPQQTRKQVIRKILALASEPRPRSATKLQGSTNLYRIRHSDYRIVYKIQNNELVVLIIKFGHRRGIYQQP